MTKVLIVLPVHNEEVILATNVRQLVSWCERNLGAYDWRIHIAENGSTDRTAETARTLSAESPRVECSASPQGGRGRTLSRVWTEAAPRFDVLSYMDIDLSSDLAAFPRLIEAATVGDAVAFGSRYEPGSAVVRSPLREATSRVYRLLARGVLGIEARDIQCGFKACSSSAWLKLRDKVAHPGWFWDTELLLWAERLGFEVSPVAVAWVETRDLKRKSTVKIIPTVLGYLRDVFKMRVRLWRGRGE